MTIRPDAEPCADRFAEWGLEVLRGVWRHVAACKTDPCRAFSAPGRGAHVGMTYPHDLDQISQLVETLKDMDQRARERGEQPLATPLAEELRTHARGEVTVMLTAAKGR